MARRLSKLQYRPLTSSSKLSFIPFSTTVSAENPQNSTTADGQDHLFNDQIHNLRVLLQQGRNDTAYNFTKSLILSNPSSFSSPSHLLSFFTSSSDDASLNLTLSEMLLSVCSESKMHSQVSELYDFMRQEGRLPSFGYVRMIVESLVESKKFDNVLDLFKEMVGLGFRPDKLP
jgi:pentatricopeptide repeat protein